MELQTISQVSKSYGISTRMLRYYEQIGLIQSLRKENYAYRIYDETAISRLRQIIVLRKLRIPVKQIVSILNNFDATETVEIFRQNITELDEEITALSTVKSILIRFIDELREKADINLNIGLLGDEAVFSVINTLSFSKNQIMEAKESFTMEELSKANESLSKLTDKNVRIVYLPPAAIAAYQYEGDEPERHVHEVINKFVLDSDLIRIKPDLRHYGFNSPNPGDETGAHGYEMWVTIPDDMSTPEPLIKKHFEGGLYAAHMIPFGAFEEWDLLIQWVQNNNKYEYRGDWNANNMFGFMEESLNYINRLQLPDPEGEGMQLDLLIPIKEK